jgi:protein-tyrosine kinase
VIIDSPSSVQYSDAQTIALRAGTALIVARKNSSRAWQVKGVSESVEHASAVVVGTVLNDF